MTTARTARWAVVLAGLAAAGCVDRRFVIESNVPNAQVYIDNRPVGPAPSYAPFDYYGTYTFTVVQPGYETLVERRYVAAPWYSYPPFDFVAEILWPFRISDRRYQYFELKPARQARTDEVIGAAEALRERGMNLPPPSEPSPQPRPPAQPQPPAGQPLPPPSPVPGVPPGGTPLVPSVAPTSGYTPQAGGTFLR